MLRKIGQLTAVSLKFFFDLDYAFCHHALLMTLVGLGLFKLLFTKMLRSIDEGWQTVKHDYTLIRAAAASYTERWKSCSARDRLAIALRKVSDMLATKNLRDRNADDRSLIINP